MAPDRIQRARHTVDQQVVLEAAVEAQQEAQPEQQIKVSPEQTDSAHRLQVVVEAQLRLPSPQEQTLEETAETELAHPSPVQPLLEAAVVEEHDSPEQLETEAQAAAEQAKLLATAQPEQSIKAQAEAAAKIVVPVPMRQVATEDPAS